MEANAQASPATSNGRLVYSVFIVLLAVSFAIGLLPLVAPVLVLWLRRQQLRGVDRRPSDLALLLLIPGLIWAYYAWHAADFLAGSARAALAALVVVILLIWGIPLRAKLLLPAGLLYFSLVTLPPDQLPLPYHVIYCIGAQLQMLEARMVTCMLSLLGLEAHRAGGAIGLANSLLALGTSFAEWSMLNKYLLLGVIIASLRSGSWWGKVVIVAAAILLGVVLNAVRVAALIAVNESGSHSMLTVNSLLPRAAQNLTALILLFALARVAGCRNWSQDQQADLVSSSSKKRP